MTYYTADSYKDYKRVGEPFDRNGRKYTVVECKCDRCVNGIFPSRIENNRPVPHPAYGGVCLKCGGAGIITKTVRLYTEKELASMNKAKTKRREKAEEAAVNRLKKRQMGWPQKNGFDDNGKTWVFIKGDTYCIKESLKEKGFKFNYQLGWHGAQDIEEELPEGYEIRQIDFNDVYSFNYDYEVEPEFIGKGFIDNLKKEVGAGEFVGQIGERLRAIEVQLMSIREYDSYYGAGHIYQFSYNGNILVWMTTKDMELKVDEWYVLTGTVKKHETYRDMNQIYLNRCIVKEK